MKKKKAPKFLLAKNEAAQPGTTFIVHTQTPEFLGEILRFDSLQERNDFLELNSEKETLQVTPTTIFVVVSYFNTDARISDHRYLKNKIVHWILANYINSDAFNSD
jgi:hypothetical protein